MHMAQVNTASFTAAVYKVGINPTISVPEEVAQELGINGFSKIKGTINGKEFSTTLIPVAGKPHRLYLNSELKELTGIDFGDVAKLTIELDK